MCEGGPERFEAGGEVPTMREEEEEVMQKVGEGEGEEGGAADGRQAQGQEEQQQES